MKRIFILFAAFGWSLKPALAQDDFFDEFKKKANDSFSEFVDKADKDIQTMIQGWNNDIFPAEQLASQPANTESIAIEEPPEIQTPVAPGQSNQTLPPTLPATVTTTVKLWAVVVGVSKYAVDKLDLRYADDDAQTFARFLASPEGGSIPEERLFMHIDEDADHTSVHETIKNVFSSAGKEDGIIFYFSGHGSPSAFVLHDYGKPSVYMENGQAMQAVSKTKGLLSHRYLNYMIDNSNAKYKYCIIDACHSASMLETKSKSIAELSQLKSFYAELDKTRSGSVYILSSMEDEVSYENRVSQVNLRGGYFTYFLIKGIRGEADYNGDRIVTVVEAFDYCKKGVMAVTKEKQNPAISGQYSFNMPIGVVRQ